MERFIRKLLSIKFYFKRDCRVLLYHGLDKLDNMLNKNANLNFLPRAFEQNIVFFKKYYKIISINDFLSHKERRHLNNSLLITFDDGFRSSFTCGAEIARKFNIPITIFVNTAFIGNHRLPWHLLIRYITNIGKTGILVKRLAEYYEDSSLVKKINECNIKEWTKSNYQRPHLDLAIAATLKDLGLAEEELGARFRIFVEEADLQKADPRYVAIGCHSHTHPVMSALSYSEQYAEIDVSQKLLRELNNNSVNAFAIPFGTAIDYNNDTIRAAFDCGMEAVFTAQGNPPFVHKKAKVYDRRYGNLENLQDLIWILAKPDFLNWQFFMKVVKIFNRDSQPRSCTKF